MSGGAGEAKLGLSPTHWMEPMFKTVTSLFVAAVVVAVLGVADAHATTFCVPSFHAGCTNDGVNVAQANLETAMGMNATDGIADTIDVDGVELTDTDTFSPAGSDPLTVRGAGPTTRLTSSSSGNIFIVNLAAGGNTRQITMRDLTIVLPASLVDNGGAAAQISDDALIDVDIESRNPGASALPAWIGGGTFRGGRIYAAASGTFLTSIRTDANATGTVNIEDAVIDHPVSSAVNATGPGTVNVRRSELVSPGQAALTATSGTTNVENTVIELAPTTPAIYAFANSASNVTINADHVTVGGDGGNAAAFYSQVATGQLGNASLTVANSIARNTGAAYLRQAPASPANGNAALTIRYSNFHLTGSEVDSGDGVLDTSTGNIDADPLFVSATDLRLPAGSPSIDAGDPGSGLNDDFDRNPRPVDGDTVAGAIRDQGAFEYQPPAPVDPVDPTDPSDPANPSPPDQSSPETLKVKGPKAKIRKRKARFEFSSEVGASFSCELDGKPVAGCSSPLRIKHLKRGKHVLAVAAADAAGNVDDAGDLEVQGQAQAAPLGAAGSGRCGRPGRSTRSLG